MMKQCQQCQAEYNGSKKSKYCSQKCFHESPSAEGGKRSRCGKKNSPEHQAALVRSRFGKKHTAESLAKMSASMKGKFAKEKHWAWNPNRTDQVRKRKTKTMCYAILWRVLIGKNVKKSAACYEMLGYRPEELKVHLERLFEPGMTWENHGQHGWHIDHIRPICTFPEGTEPIVINALENLRPMWAEENIRRPRTWK